MVVAAARSADELPPPAAGTGWTGFTLSLLVHGLLLAALAWGVRWQSVDSGIVAAELWSAVPQAAPPPAAVPLSPPPPPQPPPERTQRPSPATMQREAEIALEKARRQKVEQDRQRERQAERERAEKQRQLKLERERQERREKQEKAEKAERAEKAAKAERDAKTRAQAEAREKAAAEQREARQREENLARMMGQLGGSGSSSAKGGSAGGGGGVPSAGYAGRIVAAIKPNIVFAEDLPGNPAAEVEVRAGPAGTIIGRTLVRSSGHPEWDDAVLRAIDRTGALPKDADGRVPSRLTITFRYRD